MRAAWPMRFSKAAAIASRKSPAAATSSWKSTKRLKRSGRVTRSRGASPFFLTSGAPNGGNYRSHGKRFAREDRCANDGMQARTGRGGRRSRTSGGNPPHQAGKQSKQGRLTHYG